MIERTEPLEQAAEQWGREPQIDMGTEECAELIRALSRYMNGRSDEAAVIDEIADVQIMAAQLALIFGEDAVAEQVEQKLDRLEERLAKAQ